MKKLLIPLTLILVLLPFIFIQTIYPFFRFGMFAEVENKSVEEDFAIQYKLQNNENWKLLNASDLGFDESVFELMKRNYYYRGNGELLLGKSHRAISKIWEAEEKAIQEVSQWRLIRESAESDTIFLVVGK